jgi:hypothetical protein
MKKYVLIVLGFTLLALVSCTKDAGTEKLLTIYRWDGGTEDLLIENDFLALRFLPETAEILLTEKDTGTVWRSNPENAVQDAGADEVTRQLLQSQFSLLYADSSGVGMTLSSHAYSVEKGMYEYAVINGGLEVNYTVGNIPRVYYFPAAAPRQRMDGFWDKMNRSDKSKVEASFRLYDINDLRASDDNNALLAAYPDLANGPV